MAEQAVHVTESKLSRTRANLAYLANPKNGAAPASLFTRQGLKSLRYVMKFAFWRLVRYFKYAAIAAGSAALAGTFIGAAIPWVGALAIPSIPVAGAIGLTTSVIKYTWAHRGNHFRQGWLVGGEGRDAREDEKRDAKDAEREFNKSTRRAEHSWSTEAF